MVANIGQYGNGDDFLQDTLPRLISSFASGALGYAQAMNVISTDREHDETAKALAEQRTQRAGDYEAQATQRKRASEIAATPLPEDVNNIPSGTPTDLAERWSGIAQTQSKTGLNKAKTGLTDVQAHDAPALAQALIDLRGASADLAESGSNLKDAQTGMVKFNAVSQRIRANASATTAGASVTRATASTTSAQAALDRAITNASQASNSAENQASTRKLLAAREARLMLTNPQSKLNDETRSQVMQVYETGLLEALSQQTTPTPMPSGGGVSPTPMPSAPMPQANSAPITSPHSSGPPNVAPLMSAHGSGTPNVAPTPAGPQLDPTRKAKADSKIHLIQAMTDPAQKQLLIHQVQTLMPDNDPAKAYILQSIGAGR